MLRTLAWLQGRHSYFWITGHKQCPPSMTSTLSMSGTLVLSQEHALHTYHTIWQITPEAWIFPSVLWHCWLGDRKGIRPVKCWVLVCWWWWLYWNFARLIAPLVTTTSITLSSNKIQSGDILVPANPGPPGKWTLNRHTPEAWLHHSPITQVQVGSG